MLLARLLESRLPEAGLPGLSRPQEVLISDLARLLQAIRFSADQHRHQRRKDAAASPYINHPIEVASILAEVGHVTDSAVLMAAVLHDTLEDTETTPQELEHRFGPEVRALVEELTDDKRLAAPERKRLQVEHAPALTTKAKLIKLGDKIANVRDITLSPPAKWTPQRRSEYLDWTERVIAGCRNVNAGLEACYDAALAAGRRALVEAAAHTGGGAA